MTAVLTEAQLRDRLHLDHAAIDVIEDAFRRLATAAWSSRRSCPCTCPR